MLRKTLVISSSVLVVLAVSLLLCLWFWRPGYWYCTPNHGHRLGGDFIQTHPENTLEVFRLAIDRLEELEEYRYSECDLRETADNQIVLFHDWDLARMVPNTQENRQALGVDVIDESVVLADLTLKQLQSLKLKSDCRIPTLEEFFECVKELDPQKPILLEIKLLRTEECCERVIEMAAQFRDETGLEIHFLAFVRNIKRSHSQPRRWLDQFQRDNFRVYQAFRPIEAKYDLCETW